MHTRGTGGFSKQRSGSWSGCTRRRRIRARSVTHPGHDQGKKGGGGDRKREGDGRHGSKAPGRLLFVGRSYLLNCELLRLPRIRLVYILVMVESLLPVRGVLSLFCFCAACLMPLGGGGGYGSRYDIAILPLLVCWFLVKHFPFLSVSLFVLFLLCSLLCVLGGHGGVMAVRARLSSDPASMGNVMRQLGGMGA